MRCLQDPCTSLHSRHPRIFYGKFEPIRPILMIEGSPFFLSRSAPFPLVTGANIGHRTCPLCNQEILRNTSWGTLRSYTALYYNSCNQDGQSKGPSPPSQRSDRKSVV